MFNSSQEQLLENFANKSDKLFELGVITSDSFSGEIGEYIVCQYFNLKKTNRVTKAVDGISSIGKRYQVKSKVISNDNFGYSLKNLEQNLFDILAIVYFDKYYNPLKIIIVPSNKIEKGIFNINSSTISKFENIDGSIIKIPYKIKTSIREFAEAYNILEESKIIRSRRVVGDIGEFYAYKKLNLILSENRNEKGIDARHENGLTFEIKTRRVYESDRRTSETRRINNLIGKCADYLIVVVLDRAFKCAGMWIIPMNNIINPKSANLNIVNNTHGAMNIVPSKISWLNTSNNFQGFDKIKINKKNETIDNVTRIIEESNNSYIIIDKPFNEKNKKNYYKSCLFWIILVLIYVIYALYFTN